ncbi:MAG: hypothetical protein WC530_08385 [Candidatus Omnitrophota bacterium]|jgi:hypothetical protein
MKKIIPFLILALFAFQQSSFAYRSTRGYVKRSSGTYVAPHYSSTPNRIKADNWSAKGNVNPFTGKKGYKQSY